MSKVVTAPKEFFPTVKQIKYEGRDSKNPLAFRWYNANQKVAGKTMKDHLRFAVAYWHTICGNGTDMFGRATKDHFPWFQSANVLQNAKDKFDAAFEFATKLGIPYYCFHDVDVIAEGKTIPESEKNLRAFVTYAKQKQKDRRHETAVGNC